MLGVIQTCFKETTLPELPEVEVVRRGLEATIVGRRLQRVIVRAPRLRFPLASDLDLSMAGTRLVGVSRRSKYLLLDFASQSAADDRGGTLLVHLGMSGTLRFEPAAPPPGRHDHVDLVFEHGTLRFRDPRRFGAVLWHPAHDGPIAEHPLFARLGVEPLSAAFDGDALYAATRGRKVSIKQFLLAGTGVVGVGNIYASESLFRSGIRPSVAAGRISRERCQRLAEAIRATLSESIAHGGTTLRDFFGSDGQGGYFQNECLVYGREGEPCRNCAAPIRMIRQQQRATFYCPNCQR